MERSGADLALLLLGGFRTLADRATAQLAERGYGDVRPAHEFALQAIAAGADSASALGRRLAVTKQAAAKTIALLEERGFVTRESDETDARRTRLHVTDHGHAMMREGAEIFDSLRADWERRAGADRVAELESVLRELVGDECVRFDSAGGPAEAPA